MKLDEVVPQAGRPIAYYPRLRQIAGSTNAAILLCQLIYWTGKQRDTEGWIFKTAEELADQTGLTYKEQFDARRRLRQRGFLFDRYARSEHQLYFRLNLDAFNADSMKSISEHLTEGTMASSPKADGTFPMADGTFPPAGGTLPQGLSLIGTSEITPESTAEKGHRTSRRQNCLHHGIWLMDYR